MLPTTDYNGADAGGRVSNAVGAGAYPSAESPGINPAGTVTAPGSYGEHPTPEIQAERVLAPAVDAGAFDLHGLSHQLGAIAGLIAHIDNDVHEARVKGDFYKVFNLSSAPYRLDRYDRRYSRILVSANVAVTVDTGIGNITVNLVAGWNILNYPDGAMISTAAAAANVLYLCSDSANG